MPVALRRRHDLRSAVGSALAAANEPIIEAPEPGGDSPEAEAPRAEAEEDGVLRRFISCPLTFRLRSNMRLRSTAAIFSPSHTDAGCKALETPR